MISLPRPILRLPPWARFVLSVLLVVLVAACAGGEREGSEGQGSPADEAPPPNVLFIAVDDLNDWIEPLGGHPQAKTPNLSRLADEGVLFTRAYTASPSCNPSRTALLTGFHPSTSGMYSNYQYWREVMPDVVTLPRYFANNGYWAAGAGKIFHNNQPDPRSWDDYFPSLENHMPNDPRPPGQGPVNMPAFEDMYMVFDWEPLSVPDSAMGDYRSVDWIIQQLQAEHDKPFFLAAGIYKPHLPWYVPQKYFDTYPLDSVQLTKVRDDDLADVPERAVEIAHRGGNYHEHVMAADQWREATQGYLASITFADAQVGRLLDALDRSPYRDNTIVVLWSDHGWQLGEKEHWRKFALWDNVSRVVMMMRVPPGVPGLPGGTPAGVRSGRTVSLLDLFPTLVELAGLPQREDLDGHSLVPLLADPDAEWDRPVLTSYEWGEFGVRDERWHYIRYIDGSEELYDMEADPEEWTNLAGDPAHADVKARLAAVIPSEIHPFVDTSIELQPHHIPPLRSVEDYLDRKARGLPR